MTVLERSLEVFFHRKVREVGGHAVKITSPVKGVPDRLVLLPGGMYLVELKTTAGRRSEAQKLLHERWAALGAQVYTLYGREDIERWIAERLDELGERR